MKNRNSSNLKSIKGRQKSRIAAVCIILLLLLVICAQTVLASDGVNTLATTETTTQSEQTESAMDGSSEEIATSYSEEEVSKALEEIEFNTPEEIAHYNTPDCVISVESGTITETAIKNLLPNATYKYVKSFSDGILSVTSDKSDALACEKTAYITAVRSGTEGISPTTICVEAAGEVCAGISYKSQIPDLKEQIDKFLSELDASGSLDEIMNRWIYEADYEMPVIPQPENYKGTLIVGTSALVQPYTFYYNNEVVGSDIEIARRFAAWAGYEIEIKVYDWDGLAGAVTSGKVDAAFSDYYRSDEREKEMAFSIPYRTVDAILIVKDETAVTGFFEGLVDSFVATFITEDRWRLLLQGFIVTLVISLAALVIGSLFGFLLTLITRINSKVARVCVAVFNKIVLGLPIVVLLMILYYLIFSGRGVDGTFVAIVGFSISFGVAVANMLITGINSIDPGQWEAGYTLGFKRSKVFNRIILPQAVNQILPLYKGEFINMVKLTSVVGYISVVDLTKAGDIIRSRTYDAFFPLIVTAIIYFFMTWAITALMTHYEKKILPGKHKPKDYSNLLIKDYSMAPKKREKSDTPVISVRNLMKTYGEISPLKDVSADIYNGETICLVGPSGTGKTTMLRCINRLETPTSGDVYVFGKNMSDKKTDTREVMEHMGMVFQSYNLFSHLTIIENMMLAPTLVKHMSKEEAYTRSMKILKMLGIADKENCYPSELSGGQKQRVAIGRTMAMNPDVIFLDEPTSALDPRMTREVVSIINKIRDAGYTMLIVTHDMKLAQNVSSRVFFMDQGVIYEEGTPEEIFLHPKKEKTIEFVTHMRTVELHIEDENYGYVESQVALIEFCENYRLKGDTMVKISRFLKVVGKGILDYTKYKVPLDISISYDEDDETVSLAFKYAGGELNLMKEKIPAGKNNTEYAFEEQDSDAESIEEALQGQYEAYAYSYEDGVNTARFTF